MDTSKGKKYFESIFPLLTAIVAPAIFFILFYQKAPMDTFFVGDAGIKYLQIAGLSEPGYPIASFPYPAVGIDPELSFLPGGSMAFKGRVTGVFPCMFSMASWPFWRLSDPLGLYAIPFLGVVLSFYFAYLTVRTRVGFKRGFCAMALLVLSSPIMIYGIVVWEHSIAIGLIAAGVCLWLYPNPVPRRDFLGGVSIAMSVWFRNETYCFIFGLGAAFLISNRSHGKRISAAASGGLAALLPFWAFNQYLFGHPLGLEFGFTVREGFWASILKAGERFESLLNLIYPVRSSMAKISLIILIATIIAGLAQKRSRSILNVKIFLLIAWATVAASLMVLFKDIRSYTSLAGIFPVILAIAPLSRYGDDAKSADRDAAVYLASGIGLSLLAFFITAPNSGGLQWGPRYLLPLIPLSAALIFTLMPKKIGANEIAAITITALFGLSMTIKGADFVSNFKVRNSELVGFAQSHVASGEFIVTDQRWFPQVAARLWFGRPMLVVKAKGDVALLAQRLKDKGAVSFWLIQLYPSNAGDMPKKNVETYILQESIPFAPIGRPVLFSHYVRNRQAVQ